MPPPRAPARRRPAPARGSPRAEMLPDTPPLGGTARRSHLPDRPYLDETPLAERDLLRPLDGVLLGIALDQVEAAESLLRLGEGAVHDLALASLQADAAGVAVRAQALSGDHLAGRLQLVAEAPVPLHDGFHLRPRRRGCALVIGA